MLMSHVLDKRFFKLPITRRWGVSNGKVNAQLSDVSYLG